MAKDKKKGIKIPMAKLETAEKAKYPKLKTGTVLGASMRGMRK